MVSIFWYQGSDTVAGPVAEAEITSQGLKLFSAVKHLLPPGYSRGKAFDLLYEMYMEDKMDLEYDDD